jgi:hypothetical protein
MTKKEDHDRDRDPGPANDNGGPGAIAPAPAGGALAALTGLATVLNKVDTASVAGRSGLPMLSFKARDNNGTWLIGQKKIVVEADSRWAINPQTFKWGYICFDNDNKPTERIVPVSQPKPDVAELPDTGFEWQEEWAVNMKCTSGADTGTEVTFKASTVGGIQAIAGMIDTIRDRLNGGMHDGKISPIVLLEKDSYQHGEHGKTWYPVLSIVDWMPLSGPTTAPASPPPTPPTPPVAAAEQPRRRRVG